MRFLELSKEANLWAFHQSEIEPIQQPATCHAVFTTNYDWLIWVLNDLLVKFIGINLDQR